LTQPDTPFNAAGNIDLNGTLPSAAAPSYGSHRQWISAGLAALLVLLLWQ
jgi:hypothetical protein